MDSFTSLKSSLNAIQQIINLDIVPSFDDLSNNSQIFNDLINSQNKILLELSNISPIISALSVIIQEQVDIDVSLYLSPADTSALTQ